MGSHPVWCCGYRYVFHSFVSFLSMIHSGYFGNIASEYQKQLPACHGCTLAAFWHAWWAILYYISGRADLPSHGMGHWSLSPSRRACQPGGQSATNWPNPWSNDQEVLSMTKLFGHWPNNLVNDQQFGHLANKFVNDQISGQLISWWLVGRPGCWGWVGFDAGRVQGRVASVGGCAPPQTPADGRGYWDSCVSWIASRHPPGCMSYHMRWSIGELSCLHIIAALDRSNMFEIIRVSRLCVQADTPRLHLGLDLPRVFEICAYQSEQCNLETTKS